jgi:hypothetical protein
MQTTSDTSQTAVRHDLYTAVHKGLRACMAEVLTTVGRIDASDAAEVADGIAKTRVLLEMSRAHLFVENQFIHAAMEARRRGAACVTANQHVEQEEMFERIDSLILSVERTAGRVREENLLNLYRALALFVADNFTHMHVEELDNNEALWSLFTDDELRQLHGQIMKSIEPAKKALMLRWMLPFVAPPERTEILAGLRQAMPQQAFEELLSAIRPHLREKDSNALSGSLHFN